MLSSFLDASLKLSKMTSPQILFDYDCIARIKSIPQCAKSFINSWTVRLNREDDGDEESDGRRHDGGGTAHEAREEVRSHVW